MYPLDAVLPPRLLERATLRGTEYAWPVDDIPAVIEAARAANLVNVGGQLQFRFSDGKTAELDWIAVDTLVSDDLPWSNRVHLAAEVALFEFKSLKARYDFIAEGRAAYGKYLEALEASGGTVADALCFVWYLEEEGEAALRSARGPSRTWS
jgi:hypothetical protein